MIRLSAVQMVARSSYVPSIVIAVLMIGLTLGFSSAFAASFKVGIIDPHAVIEKSKAGKRAIATLQEHANVRKKLLEEDQKAIKDLEEILQKANSLTEEERKAKQDYYSKTYQDYQQKIQEFQKRGQGFEQELAQKQKDMVVEYMKKIKTATKAVAEKHGFSVVIDKGSDATMHIVLYNKPGLDITNEVVKEFDRRYK